jgi:hypothetical protein
MREARIDHLRATLWPDEYIIDGVNMPYHWVVRCDGSHICLHQEILEHWAEYGVKFLFGFGSPWVGMLDNSVPFDTWRGRIQDNIDTIARRYVDCTVGIEAPNEYDIGPPTTPNQLQPWADHLREYINRVGFTWQSRSEVNHLPYVGPSFARQDTPAELGDMSAVCDAKNAHPYSGNTVWTQASAAAQKAKLAPVHGDQPIWATEYGPWPGPDQPYGSTRTIDEREAAIVLTKQHLSLVLANFVRGYHYSFFDTQQGFGILNNDLSERQTYKAIRKMNEVAGDKPTGAEPPALAHTISGAPSDMKKLVTWKDGGKYVVWLWREAPLGVAPATITLSFPDKQLIAVHDLINSQATCPKDASTDPGWQGQMNIADDPIAFEVG